MSKRAIGIMFVQDGEMGDRFPPSEDTLVRALRSFQPAPIRSYTAGNTRVAVFECEADTEFAAAVLAADLFDRLTAHMTGEIIHPKHWQHSRLS